MPLQDHGEKILYELGLTQSQARVYLSLIRLGGQSTVKTVSDFAGIARQDVYRITTELQQLSLIETVIGNPYIFKAVPMREVVSFLVERRRKKTRTLLTEATEFLHNLSDAAAETTTAQGSSQFVLIPKKEVVMRRTEKSISTIKEKLQIFTPWREQTQWLFRQSGLFHQALARGVNIQVITEKPNAAETCPEILRVLLKEPNFQLRNSPNPHQPRFSIFDSREVFIATLTKPNAGESPALWTTSPPIIRILEDYFEMKWTLAEKYELTGKRKRDNSAGDVTTIRNTAIER